MRIIKFTLLLAVVITITSCASKKVSFLVSDTEELKAPVNIDFSNTSEEWESFVWDFGDGTMSTDTAPSHTYYLSGTYTVTLKGKSGKKIKESKQLIEVMPPDRCLIRIETEYGEMLAELSDLTPLHRDNFIKLADEGFYNDLLFHRVIKGFMVQGGDPNSRNAPAGQPLGSGSPGYQIDAEFNSELAHVKGAIAAARVGGPSNPKKRSRGSQFYIVHGKPVQEASLKQMERRHGQNYPEDVMKTYIANGGTPFLDQDYTVFGQVIQGLEVIDKIAQVETNRQDRPDNDVAMKVSVIK